MADVTLDTKGLSCPLPVLKLKKAMGALPKGQTLAVLATDPGAVRDFEAFCQATGNTLVSRNLDQGVYTFLIKAKS